VRKAEVFKLPSGAALHVGTAEFSKAAALMQAVLKQLSGIKLNVADMQRDMEELKNDPSSLMTFIDKAISLATSDDVKSAVFACMGTVKYSPKANEALISVDAQLFDDQEFGEQAREDYYTILYRIVEVNCKPFFAKTFSGLLTPKSQSSVVPALQ
jgi:hypothetical protein